ncbi:MAG TPA: M20/M25/M40 family metallo-hydrolase [Cyclobacteriaceae bacterium]|nr:M20/M25/M40 family metallo-hydrolase [Cyclobacteriaceae bacterium]HMV91670.1 M20/M25/M40 family metallo-hydrolase [Cyclobacteriaceae bacterium]HMX01466.1 M20/M25/M40 family metallo-hydrolase [Cyclobacteriaceae bacterium]HMX50264.1 M20/M25/M40 family metallo-hydrolase [Cyclobacteriaceae bacterium]HMY92332.1 M20/M25/M40 family metallo-hydrolase [Cyclobacteriaceae bacterium]
MLVSGSALAQQFGPPPQAPKDPVVDAIIKEATTNSQLEKLAHELMDGVGPRLVGSPKMQQAHDWAVKKYEGWNIPARNEKWGEWRGWERGVTHIDMTSPWVKSLAGTQLAWSPSTKGKTVSGDVVILPNVADSIEFQKWLPSVKGKFVMISMNQPTGRTDDNWEKHGTKESVEKMKKDRQTLTDAWNTRIKNTGKNNNTLPTVLENAGAAGIVMCYWSRWAGANKIFGAKTKKIPTIDLMLEDYGLLYRLTESGKPTKISVRADSKETGVVPTYNTVAEIKSTTNPNEYVMLSAHFDSWDGGTGATDNGTGTLVMMEAMRILKAVYPNPKRTILVGHWGSEEQGLNGSRAFVEDHKDIVANLQALFNQDNGTGRVTSISGQGFLHSYEYITRWLSKVPREYKVDLETTFPGSPGGGGSDFASFVAAGAPGFSLSSLSWDYGTYTWHTNLDTYDKIVFDDVRNNAILAAILVYQACEDSNKTARDKSVLPMNPRTGEPGKWPEQRSPTRKGGMD